MPKNLLAVAMLALGLILAPSAAWAGPQVGTVAALHGEVKIFSHPSANTAEGPPPHAKFEGLYYSVRDAQVGDRLEKGNLIRTQTGGRARVIYDNGDQIYVAPATFYKIDWKKDANDGDPELELRYGKARFVIQKGGPRTKFIIKTKSAVMGVRGTDFFVAVNEVTGETETATLRGVVEMRPPVENAAPTPVSAGQTASVPEAPATEKPAEVKIHPTTQQELQAVQRNTVLNAPEPTPPPAVETVKALEAAAEKVTLADMRAADPAYAEKIEQSAPVGETRLDAINQAAIDRVAKTAPAQGAVGPIADATLEKPKEAAPKETPKETEEPAPDLPHTWVGFRIGHHSAHLDNGNDNGSFSTDPISHGSFALSAEYEVGRNFSLLAELSPFENHGEEIDTFCNGGGSCPSPSNERFDINIRTIDLLVGLRPGIPFGRNRVFAIRALFLADLSKITGAESQLEGSSTQDLSNAVSGFALSVGAGLGIEIRPTQHLKISLDLRFIHGVGDLTSTPIPFGSVTRGLGPISDDYLLGGIAYGL